MMFELTYWVALAAATYASFVYFRDLGDVTQAVLDVSRENMLKAIRNENKLVATGLLGTGLAVVLHYAFGAGFGWVTVTLAIANAFMVGFPWIWLHVGLRNQQNSATYYSVEEAKDFVRGDESVIVIENNGEARAHPDYHIKRPHLAGSPEGLGGENVILTYCAMTHLGHGYKPEIKGDKLDLEVIAQHGNNLIMKDLNTGEPIQQMYGTRECDGRHGEGMQEWPTFRMPFKAFAKAYPEGKVFLNKIPKFSKNPIMFFFDHAVELVFLWGVLPHDRTQSLLFNTMDHEDDRLHSKEYVWGFNVGKDSVAYTQDAIREHNDLINVQVGGRAIVVAYDPEFDSVGVFYNDSGSLVTSVDFRGESDRGKLARVETVKAGSYWCVWVNFFPETDLNRLGAVLEAVA
ncbi:MAG: hypothetical protein DRQ65_01350 [Gammaproteobacteria bacterium]|nr:MAG: hypothetical protein DRQ98_05135 [Gammaproteobacteria bacterium]RLA57495.1 MAG: hypothetical protein DRQ65_01350 [Gammaproteobacteria bacterium]HDY83978.1 DUF3179 domain-containing protein [Halieaceae bacterium]